MLAHQRQQDRNPNLPLKRAQPPVKETCSFSQRTRTATFLPNSLNDNKELPRLDFTYVSSQHLHTTKDNAERSLPCQPGQQRQLQRTQLARTGKKRQAHLTRGRHTRLSPQNRRLQPRSSPHATSDPAPPPPPHHSGGDCPGPGPLPQRWRGGEKEEEGRRPPPGSYRRSRTWQSATFQGRLLPGDCC